MSTDSNNDKPSILKSTREAKGLTLEIVHEATKIPMDALRAIEEGYSVRILSPFYYRGFIKIYAEFLGLDVQEMYKQYGLDQPAAKPIPVVTPAIKQSRKVVQPPPQPNIILEQMQGGVTSVFKPKNIKLFFKIVGFGLLLLLLVKMVGCVASHMGKKQEKRSQAFNNNVGEERSVIAPKGNKLIQAQSEDNKVEVAVRAIRDTWIQVKADGNVVFQMTLSKGAMESWSADNRIELSGKNVGQLDMEVNGKHIGTLGDSERRIRKVLVTQEGLTVKK